MVARKSAAGLGPLAFLGRGLRQLLDPTPAGFVRLLLAVFFLGGLAVVRQHASMAVSSLDDEPLLPLALRGGLRVKGRGSTTTTLTEVIPATPGGKLVWQLRRSLAGWVRDVATFQEVYAMDVLKHWFHHARISEVAALLRNLTDSDTSAGWATCAIEGESCKCPSQQIRYGHTEKTWLSKDGVREIPCTLKAWGGVDVAVGMIKQCQCYEKMGDNAGIRELVNESALQITLDVALEEAQAEGAKDSDGPSSGEAGHYGHVAPEGNLWLLKEHVASWIEEPAVYRQLVEAARLYYWLENTRDTARITVSVMKAAAPAMKEDAPCENGQKEDPEDCPGYGDYHCRAACAPSHALRAPAERAALPRGGLCGGFVEHDLLWSCQSSSRPRVPAAGHAHAEAQGVLDTAAGAICGDPKTRALLDVYIDCEFLPQYLRWTSDETEWIDEAYVTYVAGQRDSKYEWQAVNLVRSVDVFSSRPIIVVVYNFEGSYFVPPMSWHRMPNVIVMKMLPIPTSSVSFNFNKIRAMIATRVRYGIELDTDQIIAPGFDDLFAGTRREITAHFPWPLMPVHWMSRDAKKGEPYHEYAYPMSAWGGQRTMRWGHAHPSWSYWALAFLCDMLYERFKAAQAGKSVIKVWNLKAAIADGLLTVFRQRNQIDREVRFAQFMQEDEDMLNIALWRDDVTKQWCKYDLEFGLFAQGKDMDRTLYWDASWYPDGLPIIFTSMHNTKRFEETDWLLTMIALCHRAKPTLSCPKRGMPSYCKAGSSDERKLRLTPKQYSQSICCCFDPRQAQLVYWGGYWYDNSSVTPLQKPQGKKERLCVMP